MSLGIADLSLYQHLSIISNELKPKYQVRVLWKNSKQIPAY